MGATPRSRRATSASPRSIWEAMLKDEATIFFGLSGAMVPAGHAAA